MKALGTILGLVSVALVCYGCAVGWQINMPASYGQCHSRGSSYNALATKAMSPSGESEAIQQQRATTTTGDALGTSVEASKATDLSAATRQGQVATETAKGVANGTGTSSGDMSPAATPTKSITPTLSVAPGGVAGNKVAAPSASPGNATADASGAAAPTTAEKSKDGIQLFRPADIAPLDGNRVKVTDADGKTADGILAGAFQADGGADYYLFTPDGGNPVRLMLTPAQVAKLASGASDSGKTK